MRYDTNSPIWLQVMRNLQTEIASGKRSAGSKLPGGRELALAYEINPNTAARVYQELEKESLCETRRGLGTFVTADPERITTLRQEMAAEAVCRFTEQMQLLGFTPEEAAGMILEGNNHA